MKTFFAALFGLVLAAARAEEANPEQALQTVVENEGKFYQLGQEQGTRAAFLDFLADDGIVFHPGPVNGKEVWKARPEKGISLAWKPLFAAIARSADLAYTTGPAEWKKNKEDEKPFGYGQFISVWKKQKDGTWKVALDVGGDLPGPVKEEEAPQVEMSSSEAPAGKPADHSAALSSLKTAEAKFAAAAKADSTIALTEASTQNVRVQRDGVFPAVGKDPARLMLSVRRGSLRLDRTGGAMSAAGDLAYSYGKYGLEKAQITERGYFLQIWRMESDGSWKIALDYQSAVSPEDAPKK